MLKKFLIALILLILLLILLYWLNCRGPAPAPAPVPPPTSDCTPDVPVTAGLLTSPPTDIANVASVIPLGNLNPGGGHVLSVDHMYLSYPVPAGGGSLSYPVHAMAAGQLFMIFRQQVADRPDYDYQLFIKHTCSVYSYVDHLHGLSPVIADYLSSYGVAWRDLSDSGTGPWVLFLGQSDGAAMLPLSSGEQIGITKNYSHDWDVGLVDTRQTNGAFANISPRHYPGFGDFASLFPAFSGIDLSIYNLGNKMRNAACFIDYMDNSSGMQTAWRDKLASTPKGCGSVGWDVAGHLRGAWFNPALDALPTVVMDNEVAALSIIPDNIHPTTRTQIGFGNAATGSTVPSLALLDPSTWAPPVTATQIAQPFYIDNDTSPGTAVNPDPDVVAPGVTVCYDLPYFGGSYNTLLLHMSDATHLKIKYNPAPSTSAQCSTLATAFPAVDSSWIEYVR